MQNNYESILWLGHNQYPCLFPQPRWLGSWVSCLMTSFALNMSWTLPAFGAGHGYFFNSNTILTGLNLYNKSTFNGPEYSSVFGFQLTENPDYFQVVEWPTKCYQIRASKKLCKTRIYLLRPPLQSHLPVHHFQQVLRCTAYSSLLPFAYFTPNAFFSNCASPAPLQLYLYNSLNSFFLLYCYLYYLAFSPSTM